MPDFTNITEVLIWAAGVGAPFLVGALLSLLVENWPGWHTLPKWVKFSAPLLASVVVACGATILLRQEEFVRQASPWFTLIAQAVITYLGTQKAYMEEKRSNYASGARLQSKVCHCADCEEVK